MERRPKQVKCARNKNVLVIGGFGSGKTEFFVKPQLMPMGGGFGFMLTDKNPF